MQVVSVDLYSIYLQQEMQPCRTDVGCISQRKASKFKVRARRGRLTDCSFLFLFPGFSMFLLITSIRGRAFICSRLFYSLLAHGLETSIGQRG